MSTTKDWSRTLTIKQLTFIVALAVFSVLLSALVLFCFSRTQAASESFPYEFLSMVFCSGPACA